MYIRRHLFIIRRGFAGIRKFLKKYFKAFFQLSAPGVPNALKFCTAPTRYPQISKPKQFEVQRNKTLITTSG